MSTAMSKTHFATKTTLIALAVIALAAGCDRRDHTTPAPGTAKPSSTAPAPTPSPSTSSTPSSPSTSAPSTSTPSSATPATPTSPSASSPSGGAGTTTDTGNTPTPPSSGSSTDNRDTRRGYDGRSSLQLPSASRLALASPAEMRKIYGVGGTLTASGDSLNAADSSFLKDAAVDGLYEVEIGKVASERGSNRAVRSYGQTLAVDHGAANVELKKLAGSRNVDVPSELPVAKRHDVDALRSASGGDFDRQFIEKVVIKEHEKDIKRFEEASRNAQDPEVRAWAGKTLPTLRQHLADARDLASSTAKARGGADVSSSGSSAGARVAQ